MRFGKTLQKSVYPPWKGNYIDYHKLKSLLREHDATDDDTSDAENPWTEQDEETFVQELINVQLDKVNAFQVEKSKNLRERTSACESKLEALVPKDGEQESQVDDKKRKEVAAQVLSELDGIAKEVSELEKYSRINFTGFLKAAKKHDRKRGTRYRVKPLLQVRLSQLPFNSEDYSPLLRSLSAMYSFVREILQGDAPKTNDPMSVVEARDIYTSHKFWVHADNITEVKTYILRRLPVLVYNPKTSKELNVPNDPSITSVYFDNPQFELYNQKVARAPEAGSLRLRWMGPLNDQPAIFLEKKIVTEDDGSREVRVQLKEKHVQEFLRGEYKFDKKLHRMEDQANEHEQVESFKKDIEELQSFIKERDLQPMVRANYTRTAFQIPGDNRVRISLDTNLALIREDTLDPERPCRDPNDWHRRDIDDSGMEYPFTSIRKGEIVRFPHALLEIKLKGDGRGGEWVNDLMASHLVKEAPRFSKFVHGVAQLFEDYVNSFPFWLGELENDIRRDPEVAFQQEQERLAKRAEEDMTVGSFLGSGSRPSPSFRPMVGSPVSRFPGAGSPSRVAERPEPPSRPRQLDIPSSHRNGSPAVTEPTPTRTPTPSSRLKNYFPSFSMSRYARARRERVQLPPGVRHPGTWLKDAGPVKVESKVWLANQRTFIKWQHVSVLLASLSLGLYNAAGEDNHIARTIGIVYTCFAIFAGVWGWYMYETRARLIRQRSGRDFDNTFGPIVVCIGLAAALVLNFAFKYTAAMREIKADSVASTLSGSTNASVTAALGLIKQDGSRLLAA
ncbi:SPX domain protein [Paecilomyces variotii No. 5]|uniref:SPX domain protein n=1 Tax=Byssochlamys spectabilis (strain No. 5 / NBRC 109023) TaxID=1356009 RepID=V5FXM5_BYSSN|nr:SPX domain protein [Paecilomyces variotii No. 5]